MNPHEKEASGKSTEHNLSRLESHAVGTAQLVESAGTRRAIKSRHAQMIAIGGTIGTGLFVGSGQALTIGGPGFLFLAYTLTSILVYGVVTAIIEVCTYLPVSGSSMAYYGTRFASPSLGFALSWLYIYSFGILVAYEITAAAIVIDYWPNNVPIAVWSKSNLLIPLQATFSYVFSHNHPGCHCSPQLLIRWYLRGIRVLVRWHQSPHAGRPSPPSHYPDARRRTLR